VSVKSEKNCQNYIQHRICIYASMYEYKNLDNIISCKHSNVQLPAATEQTKTCIDTISMQLTNLMHHTLCTMSVNCYSNRQINRQTPLSPKPKSVTIISDILRNTNSPLSSLSDKRQKYNIHIYKYSKTKEIVIKCSQRVTKQRPFLEVLQSLTNKCHLHVSRSPSCNKTLTGYSWNI